MEDGDGMSLAENIMVVKVGTTIQKPSLGILSLSLRLVVFIASD